MDNNNNTIFPLKTNLLIVMGASNKSIHGKSDNLSGIGNCLNR